MFPTLLFSRAYVAEEGIDYAKVGRGQIEEWMLDEEGEKIEDQSGKKKITPERKFLEYLMAKIPEYRQARKDRMKTRPSPFKAGWRGGRQMGVASQESKRPKRRNYLYLRGDVLLRELIQLRSENSTAAQLFPDVSRHLAKANEELKGQSPRQILSAVIRGSANKTPNYGITRPSLTVTSPVDGSEIHTKEPMIEVIYGDHVSGLDMSSLKILVNGIEATSRFSVDSLRAIWFMESPDTLHEGTNTVEALIRNNKYNNLRRATSTFDVVTLPPPDDEHFVNGYVCDGDSFKALEGAAVVVGGIEGVVFSDSTGHYVFPTPGLGEYQIDVTKDGYTSAQRDFTVEDGHGDVFVDDAFLSPRDHVIVRITEEGGVAVNSDGSVWTTFLPDVVEEDIDVSAFNLDDQEDLPAPLPELSIFTYCAKFWPDGIEFTDTAFVDQSNWRGFEEGMPVPLGHYSSETRTWKHEGFAYIGSEADSEWVEYGLEEFTSWHDPNYPVIPEENPSLDENIPVDPKDSDNACNLKGSPSLGNVNLKFGGSEIRHELPSVRSLGKNNSLSLIYESQAVKPQIVIETGTEGIASTSLPQYTGVQVNLAGRRFTGIMEASRDTSLQRIRFDAVDMNGEPLSSGLYVFTDYLSNFYFAEYALSDSFGGTPTYGTGVWTDFPVDFTIGLSGNLIVDRGIQDELGKGWVVDGLQRLFVRSDGDAMIIEGGGVNSFFERTYDATILDLAINNHGDNDVSVLLGDGLGGFGDRQDWPVGSGPRGITAGDFNDDQYIDLAIANGSADSVSILLGDGLGGFGDRQDWSAGYDPWGIVAGNFDEDQILDLAVANNLDTTVSVFLGDGLGGFGDYQNYTVDGQPIRLIADDFDGDQHLDLAVPTSFIKNSVSILLGDGLGGFGDYQEWPVGSGPRGITAGDFNEDQYVDLAVTNTSSDNISILLGNGMGGFGDRQDYPVGNFPNGIVACDFNEDQDLDLAVTNTSSDNMSVLLGNGTGGFEDRQDYPLGLYPNTIISGDFNGDQIDDLAVTNGGHDNVSILLGDGTGGFGERQDWSVGNGPNGIAKGDFNGDSTENGFRSQEGDFTTLMINSDSITHTRIYPDSSKVVFDSTGLQLASIDPNGNTISYEYDSLERLITITYPGSLITNFTYDPVGYLETITDPAGRITLFDHDSTGNLISITDPDSSLWRYEYDEDHFLTKIIDPREYETIYEYDDNGYVIKITGPDSSTNDFLASDSYNTLNEAIESGQGTPNNPAPVVLPDSLVNQFVNTKGDTTLILASPYGRPTKKTDVLGRIWKYEYNEDGLLTKVIRSDSTFETLTYNEMGMVTSRTESSNGATTTYEYDSVFNRLLMEINALGDKTLYELDDRGNTIRSINALGDTTHYFYDTRGLLTKTINALGDSTLRYYSEIGNLDSLVNELGYVTRYEYDLAGNQTAVIDPLNNRIEYEYDNIRRIVLARDPLGNEIRYIYNTGGEGACCGENEGDLLTAVVNAKGDTTKYEYDEMGRRITTIDPLGNVSRTEYDTEGRITKQIDPEGRWQAYSYDPAGNQVSQTDSLGRTYTYGYDSRDRKVRETDPLGAEIRYGYDGVGNLVICVSQHPRIQRGTYSMGLGDC
jgi:YD repeat-containing protein